MEESATAVGYRVFGILSHRGAWWKKLGHCNPVRCMNSRRDETQQLCRARPANTKRQRLGRWHHACLPYQDLAGFTRNSSPCHLHTCARACWRCDWAADLTPLRQVQKKNKCLYHFSLPTIYLSYLSALIYVCAIDQHRGRGVCSCHLWLTVGGTGMMGSGIASRRTTGV